MTMNTDPSVPDQSSLLVGIDSEVDGETLLFASEDDADQYALTGEESLVVDREPITS